MIQSMKHAFALIFRAIRPIILFEVIYKLFGTFCVLPLLQFLFQKGIIYSKLDFISFENSLELFSHPLMLVVLIVMFFIVAFYTLLEFSCLIICLNQAEHRSEIDIFTLLKAGLVRSLKIFKLNNLPFIIFTMVLVPLSTFIFASSLFGTLQVPKFIIEELHPPLNYLYLGLVTALFIFVAMIIYVFHYFVLEHQDGQTAFKAALNLSKGHRIRTIVGYSLFQVFITVISLVILLLIGIVLILGILYGGSLFNGDVFLAFEILTAYVAIAATIIDITLQVSGYAYLSSSFYHWKDVKGEKLPDFIQTDLKHPKALNNIILVPLALGIFIFTVFNNVQNIKNPKPTFLNKNMTIIAHRGNAVDAPENTIPAFQRAIDNGADYAELDVQLSKDGELIVTHDSNFSRMCGVNKNVWDMTLAEIKTLDASGTFSEYRGTEVPTLQEVMDYCQGKIDLLIELKPMHNDDEELAKAVVDLIHANNYADSSVIHSLSYKALEAVKEYDKTIICGYCTPFIQGDFVNLEAADFFTIEQTYLSKASIDVVHTFDKDIYVWTVDESEDMETCFKKGADGIITNDPKLAIETIKEAARNSADFNNLIQQLLNFAK